MLENSSLLLSSKIEYRGLPNNIEEMDLVDFNDAREYKTADCFLEYFRNVVLSPDSVIYNQWRLYRPSLPAPFYYSYYRYRHISKIVLKYKKVIFDTHEEYLLVTDLWSEGHFHWLGEALARLTVLNPEPNRFTLLLPDSPYIKTFGVDSISALGFKFKDIIFLKPSHYYKIKNLFFVTKLADSGCFISEVMKSLRKAFNFNSLNPVGKVYISRAKCQFRKVLNEKELLPILRDYGYEIITAEDLDFISQGELFSNTENLISIHGAGLSNCIFMPETSNLIEIRKKENGPGNVGYWRMGDSLGLNYWYFNGSPDSELPLVGKGCNLIIDIPNFENKILKPVEFRVKKSKV